MVIESFHVRLEVSGCLAESKQLRALLVHAEVPHIGVVHLTDLSQVDLQLVLETELAVCWRDEEHIPLAVLT